MTTDTKPTFPAAATSTQAQEKRLLCLLQKRPRMTYELRAHGISHPAARVLQLKQKGWDIVTERINTVDADGFTHVNVARYHMLNAPDEDASTPKSKNPPTGKSAGLAVGYHEKQQNKFTSTPQTQQEAAQFNKLHMDMEAFKQLADAFKKVGWNFHPLSDGSHLAVHRAWGISTVCADTQAAAALLRRVGGSL